MAIRSVAELAAQVAQDPNLLNRIKTDPVGTITSLVSPPPDILLYRMVVIALGLAVLLSIGGVIGLAAFDKTIPDLLTALGSAAIGALAGLLAPSPAG